MNKLYENELNKAAERKKPVYISIRTKLFLVTLAAGTILLILSLFILQDSLYKLDQDLIGERLVADINHIRDIIGKGEWNIRGNALYHGDVLIGDGTQENANLEPFLECEEKTGTFSYTFIKVSDEGLVWTGDKETGYQQGHFFRTAGSTRGPKGESIVGTYMDKKVADELDAHGEYLGPANVNGRQIYCVYQTLTDASGEVVGAIVVGRGIEEMLTQTRNVTKSYLIIYLFVISMVLVAVNMVIGSLIESTKSISRYLKQVGSGELPDKPLVLSSNDEMATVADSINEMVESLREKKLLSSYIKNVNKNAIVSFTVNVSEDLIISGGDFFNLEDIDPYSTPFSMLLENFSGRCVDPEHHNMIRDALNHDSLKTRLNSDPEFELTFRVSTENIIKYTKNLPGEAISDFYSSGKEWVWQCARAVVVMSHENQMLLYVDVMDVDQKMINEEKIRLRAMTDSLTGLLNRTYFQEAVNTYLSNQDARGTLFMFDLDHFKDVNDNLGHPEGDELLKKTANIIKSIFREDDIVCRLGGDEFCAFAKGFTDMSLLSTRAHDLREKGHHFFTAKDGSEIKVSFSMGISVFPTDAADADALYDCADKALYKAKEDGRDCFRFYSHISKNN